MFDKSAALFFYYYYSFVSTNVQICVICHACLYTCQMISYQPIVQSLSPNGVGTTNNKIMVQKSDFEVFEALALDSRAVLKPKKSKWMEICLGLCVCVGVCVYAHACVHMGVCVCVGSAYQTLKS